MKRKEKENRLVGVDTDINLSLWTWDITFCKNDEFIRISPWCWERCFL